jgi:hypothetical protein
MRNRKNWNLAAHFRGTNSQLTEHVVRKGTVQHVCVHYSYIRVFFFVGGSDCHRWRFRFLDFTVEPEILCPINVIIYSN